MLSRPLAMRWLRRNLPTRCDRVGIRLTDRRELCGFLVDVAHCIREGASSMRRYRRLILYATIAALVCACSVSMFISAEERVKAQLIAGCPVGAPRSAIDGVIKKYNIEVAAFDFPDIHPLHRRIIIGKVTPYVISHTLYVKLVFDERGRLAQRTFSRQPIDLTLEWKMMDAPLQ